MKGAGSFRPWFATVLLLSLLLGLAVPVACSFLRRPAPRSETEVQVVTRCESMPAAQIERVITNRLERWVKQWEIQLLPPLLSRHPPPVRAHLVLSLPSNSVVLNCFIVDIRK